MTWLSGWDKRIELAINDYAGDIGDNTETFLASGTWTCPAGVTSIQIECWGAGGGGGGNYTIDAKGAGGGGGGGAYSKKNTYAVTPGNTYNFYVGAKGAVTASADGGAGGDSYWVIQDASSCSAKGGAGGKVGTIALQGAGGAGGASASGFGDTKYSGGAGFGGGAINGQGGGGGEGSATGIDGNAATGQAGGTGTNGGDGGAGGADHLVGSPATNGTGGGGGGAGHRLTTNRAGGLGNIGKVVITYIGASVTWFPATIHLKDANGDSTKVFLEVGANYRKIAITNADGIELKGEIEKWSYDAGTPSNSTAIIHTSAEGWTINSNTKVYLYYDNTHVDNDNINVIDTAAGAAVWDGNFKAVYHMTDANIDGKYLTGWSKSGENPLIESVYEQSWITAVYSNYNNEDKIYIFVESAIDTIKCYSFTRANADNTAQWTDHGTVITGSGWSALYIEPHGIFFETQAMADTREGVGEGEGTPKWRLYVCARATGTEVAECDIGFFTAPESDLTDWTAYAGNPVYAHNVSYGYADPKVCIQGDEVWMMAGAYKLSCEYSFLTKSANGIDNWTTIRDSLLNRLLIGTLVPFSTGILLTENHSPYTTDNGYFIDYSGNLVSYSGNPIMSAGAADSWERYLAWCSIVVDKDGGWNLKGLGTAYLYYSAWNTAVQFSLGLATTSTLTEETTETTKILDSTSNNNDGVKKGINEPAEAAGQVGQAQDFDGTNDYINVGTGIGKPQSYSVELCIKPDAWGNAGLAIAAKSDASDANSWGIMCRDTGDNVEIWSSNGVNGQQFIAANDWNNTGFPSNVFTYIAGTNDNVNLRYYKNGAAIANTPVVRSNGGTAYGFAIGRVGEYAGFYSNGIIDEVRVSNIARFAVWIKGTRNSLWDTLFTYGDEETAGILLEFSETLSIADTMATSGTLAKAETLSIIDSKIMSGSLSFAETLSIVDSWGGLLTFFETLSIADSKFLTGTLELDETLEIVDSATYQCIKTFYETLSIIDTITTSGSLNLAETLSIADSWTVLKTFFETLSITDTVAMGGSLNVSEIISIIDSFIRWIEHPIYTEPAKGQPIYTKPAKPNISWIEPVKPNAPAYYKPPKPNAPIYTKPEKRTPIYTEPTKEIRLD